MEDIQEVLNTTEISLHQLTALVDCRSLHMVREGGGKECGMAEGLGGRRRSFSRNSQRLVD